MGSEDKVKGGYKDRQIYYRTISQHIPEAIATLIELMKPKYQPSVRMGAAKVILAKTLPDLQAMQISGGEGMVKMIVIPPDLMEKYKIQQDANNTVPPDTTTSGEGQHEIQSGELRETVGED